MIGLEQVAALSLRNECGELVPAFREDVLLAVPPPVDLIVAAGEDAADDEAMTAIGMVLAVVQRHEARPRAAGHQPLLDAHLHPHALVVGEDMGGGVVLQLGIGGRLAGATLVEDDDVEEVRVVVAAIVRHGAPAGTAMGEDHRHALRISRTLPVELVNVVDLQLPGRMRLDRRVEGGLGHVFKGSVT